jgi:hypothetical protein
MTAAATVAAAHVTKAEVGDAFSHGLHRPLPIPVGAPDGDGVKRPVIRHCHQTLDARGTPLPPRPITAIIVSIVVVVIAAVAVGVSVVVVASR